MKVGQPLPAQPQCSVPRRFGALNWVAGWPQHPIIRERAPGRLLEVRVIEGRVIDTVWELRVRHRAGLLSKEWSAGCLNGDNPAMGSRA